MFPCVKRALSKFLIRDYSFVSLFLLLQICSVMDCARKKSNTTLLGESGAAFAKPAIAETMERDRQTKNTGKN